MIPRDQRGAAYGIYNTVYGVAWFAGSATMGRLYDGSIAGLVGFGMAAQIGAIGAFAAFAWRRGRGATAGRAEQH
jgi:predicted MFS family arabinose efflux permease